MEILMKVAGKNNKKTKWEDSRYKKILINDRLSCDATLVHLREEVHHVQYDKRATFWVASAFVS